MLEFSLPRPRKASLLVPLAAALAPLAAAGFLPSLSASPGPGLAGLPGGAVPPAHLGPSRDVADCTPSRDGTAAYFASVRSPGGIDIPDAVGRLFGTGTENQGQIVTMFNGDYEAQAVDGTQDGTQFACNRNRSDGHPNDLATTFILAAPVTHTWSMRVLAAGYFPSELIQLSVDGDAPCRLDDGAGCLISAGTIHLTAGSPPSASFMGPLGMLPPTASPTATRPPSLPTATPTPWPVPTRTPTSTATLLPTATPAPAETVAPAPVAPEEEAPPVPEESPSTPGEGRAPARESEAADEQP